MQQSFNAGQTKGNTQVGKTREACTQGIILSRQEYNLICSLNLVQAKVEQWTETIQDTANAACRDSTSAGAQSTGDSAQLEKDHSAGFLQQVTIYLLS